MYRAYGSLEGIIDEATCNRHFRITDQRTGRTTMCSFAEDQGNLVLEALRDRRRVVATGLLEYGDGNEVLRLTLQRPLRFLGREEDLPSWRDLLGSDPDLTSGLTTEEYISQMRGRDE